MSSLEPLLGPAYDDEEPVSLSRMSDEEIEEMQMECECTVSEETLNEIYRRLEL